VKHLLDTQTFLWLVTDAPELPVDVRRELEADPELLGVPAAVPIELAIKARLGRIQPDRKGALQFDRPFREWIAQALPADKFELVPLSPAIAAEAFDLPGDFHADPFDCLIVGTARNLDVTLVTSDEAIRDYPHVKRRTFSPCKTTGPRGSRSSDGHR
jgi:PIN domain nuclease of toxin-antitoxin system